MLEERGIVVEVNDNLAIVQVTHTNRCGQCAASNNCGTASLASKYWQKTTNVTVINHNRAKVGDNVLIGIEENAILKSALGLYLPPLIGLFAGAIGFTLLATISHSPSHEILTVLASLYGFLKGLRWAQKAGKRATASGSSPVILKTE